MRASTGMIDSSWECFLASSYLLMRAYKRFNHIGLRNYFKSLSSSVSLEFRVNQRCTASAYPLQHIRIPHQVNERIRLAERLGDR